MSGAAWQRVTLPLLILRILGAGPCHGYGISQALTAVGLQPIKGAQLYPALVRLEDEGAIVARWEQSESGPARKVYELTAVGRDALDELNGQWQEFLKAADAVGGAAGATQADARPAHG